MSKNPSSAYTCSTSPIPDEDCVRDTDDEHQEQTPQTNEPRVFRDALLEPFELNREADREQHAERAVELTAEERGDDR